jgi:competence protein ComEA
MRPLIWVMKKETISSQQIGLSILILILLAGWGIKSFFSTTGSHSSNELENEIFIQVGGEVKAPGVYVFDRPPSLKDLVTIAGGLVRCQGSSELDKYPLIAQGTIVQISSNNECLKVLMGSMPAPYKVTLKIPISVNTASQEELDTIPDIGPSLAQKIINYRSIFGPFKTVDEVKCVPTVGKIRYNKIRPYIGI